MSEAPHEEAVASIEQPIDVGVVEGPVPYKAPPASPHSGGETTFFGRTRLEVHEKHGALVGLNYEAHHSMAPKVLQKLAKEAIDKHSLLFCRIIHSYGMVPIGDASVLVQCLSAHRKESFAAAMEIMDKIKQVLPIWKQEVWTDGSTWQDGKPVEKAAMPQ